MQNYLSPFENSQPVMHAAPQQQPWYRQPGYRPTNFLMDAAAKFIGQPMYDAYTGMSQSLGYSQDPNAPDGYVTHQAINRGAQGLAEGALVGSAFARAPAGAVRSGAPSSSKLDMSQEARLHRARDMGFDTETVWYRGRGNPNEPGRFDVSRQGYAFNEVPITKQGIFASNTPEVASWYARHHARVRNANEYQKTLDAERKANLFSDQESAVSYAFEANGIPAWRRLVENNDGSIRVSKRNLFANDEPLGAVTSTRGGWSYSGFGEKTISSHSGSKEDGANVVPIVVRPGRQLRIDLRGQPFDYDDIATRLNEAKSQDFDTVRLVETKDSIGKFNGTYPDEVIVFDPTNIRSVNAAFDPAKKDSANLLASNPFTGGFAPTYAAPQDNRYRNHLGGIY